MIADVESCALSGCRRREVNDESNCGRIDRGVLQARRSGRLVQVAALERTVMLCLYEAHKIRLRHEGRRVETRLPREPGTCAGSAESADITEASIAISAAAHWSLRSAIVIPTHSPDNLKVCNPGETVLESVPCCLSAFPVSISARHVAAISSTRPHATILLQPNCSAR